jgi:hypothetical protein
MAEYRFDPPTVKETPMAWNRLMIRYGIHRGISVLRIDGVYSSYRYPSLQEINTASEVYIGGHSYIIDESVKTLLTSAGYGDYITAV